MYNDILLQRYTTTAVDSSILGANCIQEPDLSCFAVRSHTMYIVGLIFHTDHPPPPPHQGHPPCMITWPSPHLYDVSSPQSIQVRTIDGEWKTCACIKWLNTSAPLLRVPGTGVYTPVHTCTHLSQAGPGRPANSSYNDYLCQIGR